MLELIALAVATFALGFGAAWRFKPPVTVHLLGGEQASEEHEHVPAIDVGGGYWRCATCKEKRMKEGWRRGR